MEHYKNFELLLEEIAEAEMMIREDMKNAYNQGLRYETYYFINKQLEKETV
jgi:hypothetical protein